MSLHHEGALPPQKLQIVEQPAVMTRFLFDMPAEVAHHRKQSVVQTGAGEPHQGNAVLHMVIGLYQEQRKPLPEIVAAGKALPGIEYQLTQWSEVLFQPCSSAGLI